MKKQYFVLLLLAPLFTIAQSNYKPGYIIDFKGDTAKGFIDYKEWDQNPKNIKFKANFTNSDTKKLNITDIKAFSVTGFEYYERYVVRTSMDYVDIPHVTTGIDTTTKMDTVFLRVLQKGKNVTLYSYTDHIKARFYIKDNSSVVPEELIYRVYRNPENLGTLITKNNYVGQLTILVHNLGLDSAKVANLIVQQNYTESDMVSIVSKINGGNSEKTNETKSLYSIKFHAGLAINASSLHYSGGSELAINANTSSYVFPKAVIGLDAYSVAGRFIYRIEAAITMSKYQATAISPQTSATYYYTENLKMVTTTFTPQLLYNLYNTNAFKFYLGVGSSFNFSSYPTAETIRSNNFGTQATVLTNDPDLIKLWLSFPVKAGIVLNKRIEIYTSYEHQGTITSNYDEVGNIRIFSAGVNLSLGK